MKRAVAFMAQGVAVGALALAAFLLIGYFIGLAIVLVWMLLLAVTFRD